MTCLAQLKDGYQRYSYSNTPISSYLKVNFNLWLRASIFIQTCISWKQVDDKDCLWLMIELQNTSCNQTLVEWVSTEGMNDLQFKVQMPAIDYLSQYYSMYQDPPNKSIKIKNSLQNVKLLFECDDLFNPDRCNNFRHWCLPSNFNQWKTDLAATRWKGSFLKSITGN